MKTFAVISFLLAISFSAAIEIDDLLENGEVIQSLGRVLSTEDFTQYGINASQIDRRVVSDAFLTTPELLKKYGYPSEIHTVQTADGYLLEVHRIPRPGAIPVYLQHGIMDSSAGWIIMGPHSALGYMLYDLGYDVWMGNVRGNRYSRNHVYLDPERRDFWDYSFHELGTIDVPAMIDYVLAVTKFEKLHYVGHSQGTTSFWVMCAQRPEYCKKIISMNALAPIAFMKYVRSPLIRAIVPFVDQIEILMKLMGVYEFLPSDELMAMGGQLLCKEEAVTQALCYNAIFLVTGYNSEQLNKTMLPVVLGHLPAGTSTKQFVHYGQLVKSGRFRMFDYGLLKNIRKYGSIRPPSYDLSKVDAPVALHFSMNDWLAHPKDVRKLEKQLPNLIKGYLVPMPKFNHLDFIIGISSRTLVHDEVVMVMKQMERKNKMRV